MSAILLQQAGSAWSKEWEEDCLKWYGVVLTGPRTHWCADWDDLPIDDTCPEAACCSCFRNTEDERSAAEIAAIEALRRTPWRGSTSRSLGRADLIHGTPEASRTHGRDRA